MSTIDRSDSIPGVSTTDPAENPSALRLRILGSWCGPLYVVGIVGGWGLLARFLIPPQSPSWTPAEVVAFYQEHTLSIRMGMVIVMFAALASVYYSSSVTRAIMEVEGGLGFVALSSILGGAGLMVLTFYPAAFWLVAAYRPDRSVDIIYLMNDLSWLQFIGGVTMFLAQPIAVVMAAFIDRRPNPVFPRWAGYYNIWTIILIIPDQLLFFFHTGPFAWNGLFGLWIPAAVFGAWFFVVGGCLRSDLNRRLAAVSR